MAESFVGSNSHLEVVVELHVLGLDQDLLQGQLQGQMLGLEAEQVVPKESPNPIVFKVTDLIVKAALDTSKHSSQGATFIYLYAGGQILEQYGGSGYKCLKFTGNGLISDGERSYLHGPFAHHLSLGVHPVAYLEEGHVMPAPEAEELGEMGEASSSQLLHEIWLFSEQPLIVGIDCLLPCYHLRAINAHKLDRLGLAIHNISPIWSCSSPLGDMPLPALVLDLLPPDPQFPEPVGGRAELLSEFPWQLLDVILIL